MTGRLRQTRLALGVAGLVVTACATRPAAQDPNAVPSPSSGEVVSSTLDPDLGSPAPPVPSIPDLGSPVPTVPGLVTVEVDKAGYGTGEVIRATVANGLSATIYTEDEKTDCSIVILERREGDRWSPVTGCSVERAPANVAIGAGRGRSVAIDPFSVHLALGSPPSSPALGAGTYRFRFTFSRVSIGGEENEVVLSHSFEIA